MIEEKTGLTNCARDIARIYPKLSPALKPLATVLQQQCRNYERNPEALRPLILATIQRITAVNADHHRADTAPVSNGD